MPYDSAAAVGSVLAKAAQNAGGLEQANQQTGGEASAFDVWTHSYQGMSARLSDFADDPVGALQNYDRGLDAAVEAGLSGDWHSSSPSAVADSLAAQAEGLGKMVDAIGEAEGALATVGATFALLTGAEQMLSTLVSVIPFPSLPAIRVGDMDIGLPHAHGHPPNLVPPAPPVPLPSTGPIIPIPILSGAARTLINGMPAGRCGDMGLGIWCGGYFPMYEVFLGSSNVWIEGARAGRLAVDITKHCIFTSPKPSDPPIGPMVGVTTMASANVLIGGVPMPSLLSLGIGAAMKGLMKGLGKAARAVRRGTRGVADDASRFGRSRALQKADADPARRVLGPATRSHPDEIARMRSALDEAGVELVERPNAMAYAPGLRPGEPGQFFIDPDASYSAWLHEYQHFLDDQADGWGGMRQLYDNDLRWQREQRAYSREIDLMREQGHDDIARELQDLMEVERQRIFGELE